MRNLSPDVIVIGAGMIGANIALKIVETGLSVLVLDQGSIAGGTTSAGEGNILVSDKEVGPELTLALRSRSAWFELSEKIGGGFELEAKGGVVVARSDEGIRQLSLFAHQQESAGVVTHQLDHATVHELEPNLSQEIHFGYHYPQDSQCQPMLAVAKILSVVRHLGGEVITGARVESFLSGTGGIQGVKTTRGNFFSRFIVNATGTWAGEIAKLAGSHLPIAPRRGFILVTAPTTELVRHKVYDGDYVSNVASESADLQSSAVVEGTKSGTILIGSSRERVGFSSHFDINVLQKLAGNALALFPSLIDLKVIRTYFGFRPYAPDHLPVIGEDNLVKGLWHATGHEGAGIGLAPATAEIVVNQIRQEECFMDASPFSPNRFALISSQEKNG